ncbi:MAG: translation initiation factor IF-2 [Clostridiales bacterium]|nr:translation initiation factor IF-2 [Clostridiales bacterium]
MTKVKLKDAMKELLKGAENTLGSVSSMRKQTDELAQAARKLEAQFVRQEEQRRAEEKQAEQDRLVRQHTKAFTMPDTDEPAEAQTVKAVQENEPVAEKKSAAKDAAQKATVKAADAAKPAEKVQSKAEAVAAAPVKAAEGEKQVEILKEAVKTVTENTAQEKQPVKAAATVKEAAPVNVQAPEKKEAAPAKAEASQPAPAPVKEAAPKAEAAEAQAAPAMAAQPQAASAQAVRPQQGRPVQAPQARPAQGAQNARPVQGGRPPVQGGAPRGPYGRPANPQGPYGRPANPQAQNAGGPYGRPANPQAQNAGGPYGRPANPQGPYGRPANPQGPYGRPANPQAQNAGGPYGRPANPQQGGGGPYGRPAGAQGAGGYGRPAGAQGGGYGRPAGGAGGGRPPMGGGARKPTTEITPAVEKERVSNYDPNKKSYLRQHDPERASRNRSRQNARSNFRNGAYEDDSFRNRKARNRKPSAQMMMAPIKIEKAYMTAETITVKDLTERIGKPAGDILKKLLLLGVMANINSELDFDTASLVCADFDVELEMNLAKTAEDVMTDSDYEDGEEDLETRPPVVTIMGHVDHGKTSLLDRIREAHVTTGEAGGITQHIGAYTATVNGEVITFLDTPGHEAFTAMRARGAQSTDIAILVVAADDGVMPQTVEAINHAKAAGVPIIVAINKMDKDTANPERIKQDLTAHEMVPEEWGGDIIMVPVSAATGEGVETLLEMILLQSEMLQLRANPNRLAKGVIIEAKLDKARGPVATVLLQNGTLHVGDNIVAGMASGRVRAMVNDRGERVQEAGPSMPVEVSGFNDVPSAGDDMMVLADDHLGRQVVQERRDKYKAARVAAASKVTLDNLFSHIDQSKITNLNLIIKADVQGSVEAVKQALEKMSNDEVRVRILHSAVGAITKDDVNLASAFDAIIIGFNIRPDANARESAEREGVDVRLYTVIYQAIEDIQKAMKGMLEPEYKEVLLGHAEVRSVFRITGSGMIAGCYITDGKLQRNAEVRLLRDNVVVFTGKLSSLKRFKDDAKEVATGYECGCSLDGHNDMKEGDIVECFVMEEIER